MIRRRTGVVLAVKASRPGAVELDVDVDGSPASAIAYPALVGEVRVGDRVLLNTTAVDLGLGTGGAHVVIAALPDRDEAFARRGGLMKLRYTPHQVNVPGVEEEGGPHREAVEAARSLSGTPVVWIPLHSMLGPVVAGARTAGARAVAYVMTDGAALPAPLSRLAAALRSGDLLDSVISVGQAFGGDLEAVNVFTGLLAARFAVGADVLVVGDGPGNTGTNTVWGASDIQSAMSMNAASILEGRPVAALRISFADPRERHRVVSHHSLTAIGRVATAPVHVAVPSIEDEERRSAVWRVLRDAGMESRHQLVEVNGLPALELLRESGVEVESMGRSLRDDPEFFLAAGAAGVLAGSMARGDREWRDPTG